MQQIQMNDSEEVIKMKTSRTSKIVAFGLLTLALAAIAAITIFVLAQPLSRNSQKNASAASRFVVHEWGTFTSIAGKDGVALEWRPLTAPADLPKFVHTIQNQNGGLRHFNSKVDLAARVRMETPVLYFYAPS